MPQLSLLYGFGLHTLKKLTVGIIQVSLASFVTMTFRFYDGFIDSFSACKTMAITITRMSYYYTDIMFWYTRFTQYSHGRVKQAFLSMAPFSGGLRFRGLG